MGSRGDQERRSCGGGRDEGVNNLETVDNWDNSQADAVVMSTEVMKADDSWGDWDNEEYTGSLADSKVFTPSAASSSVPASTTGGGGAAPSTIPTVPPILGQDDEMVPPQQQYSAVASGGTASVNSGSAVSVTVSATNSQQFPDLGHHHLRQQLDIPAQLSSATTLSAEQSQCFNSLSSQNSSQQANSYQSAPVQYSTSGYGTNHSYGDPSGGGGQQQQQVRKTTRAKVPPPSKIPSSAVEMPGDNIGYLDVQFGLDFGSKSGYQSAGVGQQQSKGQSVNNPQQTGSGSDISSSMYGKSHVALNKVNSYDKQSFHSGTPPPFNLASTQTTGQTSAQAYGMYISPMPAPHNMNMHQPMHQDSNSSGGQRPQSSSQGKTGTKQGYSPSYWTAQN